MDDARGVGPAGHVCAGAGSGTTLDAIPRAVAAPGGASPPRAKPQVDDAVGAAGDATVVLRGAS